MSDDSKLFHDDKELECVLNDFTKGFADSWREAVRNRFICWKCKKPIDPKKTIIVDRTSGFIHEECQGEYKGQ